MIRATFFSGLFVFSVCIGHAQEDDLSQPRRLLDEGKFQQALDELKPFLEYEDIRISSEALKLSAIGYNGMNNRPTGDSLLRIAVGINRMIIDELAEARCLYLLSRNQAIQGKFERAQKNAYRGYFLARQQGDLSLQYDLSGILSWSYFMLEEDFLQIMDHYDRQKELVDALDEPGRKAQVYNNMGYDLTVAGTIHMDSALTLMHYANDHYAIVENTEGRWYTLMNLTWIYQLKGDLQNSEQYGRRAFDQARSIEDRHAIVETGFQLAETLVLLGEEDEASMLYESAREVADQDTDRDKYVFDVYYAGHLLRSGNDRMAVERLKAAIEFLSTGEVLYEMQGRALLANYYLERGDMIRCVEELRKIEDPRHNYVSMETRAMTALMRVKIYKKQQKMLSAIAIANAWSTRLTENGMQLLKGWFDHMR